MRRKARKNARKVVELCMPLVHDLWMLVGKGHLPATPVYRGKGREVD